jgi:hypothetical protein
MRHNDGIRVFIYGLRNKIMVEMIGVLMSDNDSRDVARRNKISAECAGINNQDALFDFDGKAGMLVFG